MRVRDLFNFHPQVMHKCKDMMLVCLWQGSYTPCTELFAVMRTDSGFCCSFNAINQKDQL